MYYTATEFANNGGSYIYMDYSTSGSTDQYAMDIASDIKNHPDQDIYLIGHSAGANAVVAGVSILRGEDGKGDTSRIRAIVLLDPYLTTGNGAGTQYPQDWATLSNLGNQENADKLINDAHIPMWVAQSGQDTNATNFPNSRQPGVPGGAVQFPNDTHTGLAVDVAVLQKALQFFANPSNPSP
jgi:pimeloyl-ACP methyl ester carboxylesterase